MIKKEADIKTIKPGIMPLRRYLPHMVMFITGILVSFTLFAVVNNWEHKNQRIEFESRAMGYANAIQNTVHDYVESLRFVGDFFNNSEQVTRLEFSSFVMDAIARFPGIQAFSWNPLIQNSEREEYEARAREEGFKDFMFTERTENNDLVRAALRDEYVVVYYIEPLEANKPAFGYDIASNPTRLRAINRSFDTGKMSATDRITLVQETGKQFGILMLLPLYTKTVPLKTVEDRRKYRMGLVVEVLRVGDVIESALKDFSDEGIDTYLFDLSAEEADRFLYFRPSGMTGKTNQHPDKEKTQPGLSWSKTFDLADRQWQILFTPSSFYLDAMQSWHAWSVLLGSLLLTCLLIFYLSRKSAYTADIEQRVKLQTQTNLELEKEITERKKLEVQLVQAQKMEAIGQLAGGIAHDFNNILTAIINNIYLLKRLIDPGNAAYERLEITEHAMIKASGLTQQLLTFSKGGAPVKKTISLVKLIRDSAGIALSGSNVLCEFSIADNLWPVEADEGQINRVIHNLIANADYAMPAGGTIVVRAENSVISSTAGLSLEEGKYVQIVIRDKGSGISEDHLHKIFDPYFTTKERGSGLGLAISYSIVRNHGGHIFVESEPGAGTTFIIYLPASKKNITEKDDLRKRVIPGEGRILIMDDDEMVRSSLGDILTLSGYEVAYAEDGKEAIDLYGEALNSSQPFDAVIMDLTIPGGMGGKETIKILRDADPDVKAIVSSGYSDDPVMANFREYGFSDVLTKPSSPEKLTSLLSTLLNAQPK